MDSRFLVFSGFRITYQWKVDSGFVKLNSGSQSPGFQFSEAKLSRFFEIRIALYYIASMLTAFSSALVS